jgi:hypothetical protein
MSASPSLEQSHNDSEGLADSNGLQYRFSGMVFMTKLLLLNTGYGNADGKLGIAMDPNAPFFVNSALLTGLTLLFLAASHMHSERTVRPALGPMGGCAVRP